MEITLQSTLASILTELASFFGMTTQMVMENAPYWLARYGWYVAFQNIIPAFFVGLLIAAVIVGILIFLEDEADYFNDLSPKGFRRLLIIIAVVIILAAMALPIAQCAVAPEMYAIKPLIEFIK